MKYIKKYRVSISVFVILFIFMQGYGFYVLNQYQANIKDKIKFYSEKSQLYMGSSHTALGVCDTIEGVYNAGAKNEPFQFTLQKIKLLKPKKVILSLNVQNIQNNYESTFNRGLMNSPQFNYLFNTMDEEMKSEVYERMSFETKCFFILKNWIPILGTRLTREPNSILFGGWERKNESYLSEYYLKKRIFEEFVVTKFKTSSYQLKNIEKLIAYCNANKIELIIYSTPLYAPFYKAIPKQSILEFENYMNYWKAKYEFTYFDFSPLELPDDCFLDMDHLNEKGAVHFTPYLIKTLDKLR